MLDKLFQESEVIFDKASEIPLKGHELLQQISDTGVARELRVNRVEAELYIAWLKARAPQLQADCLRGTGECKAPTFEIKLTTFIRYICDGLNLRFDEWNMDERLACAIRKNPKVKMIYPGIFTHHFDSVLETADLLGVDLDPKFLLFRGIDDPSKTITVQVYDFKTKQVTEMPLEELAPGYVKARIQGIEGEYFVNAADAKIGEYKHPEFGKERKEEMEKLVDIFHEVYSLTAQQWEDGFRKDTNMEKEIAIWFGPIAKLYLHYTKGKSLSLAAKQDYFNIILTAVTSGPDNVASLIELKELSKSEMKRVIRLGMARLPEE